MTDGENLDHHLRDDHHADRSPLVDVTFVHHFVRMTGGSVGAWQTEARIVGKVQKMAVALLRHAPGAEEVQRVEQIVGQGGGMRVRQGTWDRKALALVRVLPEG
jgi:hypothetical protein